MDGLTLLDEARAAGLEVQARDGRLMIRGPRRAEPVVRRLLAHKALVLHALTGGGAGSDITPDQLPADWHLLWDERAAIMEYEGEMPRERAETRALADILDQMRRAGNLPKNDACK
jgi:hypothetical protein